MTRSAHRPDGLQPFPLDRDGLRNALPAQRVAPAGALVAADQDLVASLQEQGAHVEPLTRSSRRPARARPAARRPGRPPGPPGRWSSRGRSTSSATLVIRAVGMLSITNQPRSSKVAPAWDRPAPDKPVMMRNSATACSLPAARGCARHLAGGAGGRGRRAGPAPAGPGAWTWAASLRPRSKLAAPPSKQLGALSRWVRLLACHANFAPNAKSAPKTSTRPAWYTLKYHDSLQTSSDRRRRPSSGWRTTTR